MTLSISWSYHMLSTVLPLMVRRRLNTMLTMVDQWVTGQRALMKPAIPVMVKSAV